MTKPQSNARPIDPIPVCFGVEIVKTSMLPSYIEDTNVVLAAHYGMKLINELHFQLVHLN